MAEKTQEDKNIKAEERQNKCEKTAQDQTPLAFSLHPSPNHSLSGSHSVLLSPTPLSSTPPLFHLSPFLASAPHPISGSPLNKSWRDNSAIVAPVWEPWTETNAVYPSSGTA